MGFHDNTPDDLELIVGADSSEWGKTVPLKVDNLNSNNIEEALNTLGGITESTFMYSTSAISTGNDDFEVINDMTVTPESGKYLELPLCYSN